MITRDNASNERVEYLEIPKERKEREKSNRIKSAQLGLVG